MIAAIVPGAKRIRVHIVFAHPVESNLQLKCERHRRIIDEIIPDVVIVTDKHQETWNNHGERRNIHNG